MKTFKYSKVSMLEKIFNHICKLAYSDLTIIPLVASPYNFLSSLDACSIYLWRHTPKTWLCKGRRIFLTLHLASQALFSHAQVEASYCGQCGLW